MPSSKSSKKKGLAEQTYAAIRVAAKTMTPEEKADAEAKTDAIIERVRASTAAQRRTAPEAPAAKQPARSS